MRVESLVRGWLRVGGLHRGTADGARAQTESIQRRMAGQPQSGFMQLNGRVQLVVSAYIRVPRLRYIKHWHTVHKRPAQRAKRQLYSPRTLNRWGRLGA